ncbi:MAG: hypothetical protein IJ604_11905 [Prevotella sp.]|nr:hypothetical protein [Prevotella sp.]
MKTIELVDSIESFGSVPTGKLLINTINAHSYNTALKDGQFAEALVGGDVLVPYGASILA